MLRPGFLLLAWLPVIASAQLEYSLKEPATLRGGSGVVRFELHAKSATSLNLRYGSFRDSASHAVLPSTQKVSFVLAAGGASPPAKMAAGDTLELEADLSNMAGVSGAEGEIFNGTTRLGELPAEALDAPFNVSIVGDGVPDKPLVFENGVRASITLKNGDAEPYLLDCNLEIDGNKEFPDQLLTLAPNATSRIFFTPSAHLYSWTDAIRPSTRTVTLTLGLHPGQQGIPGALPLKALPLSLSMMEGSPDSTKLLSYLYVTLVLLLGGCLSLLGNSVLPNTLRKIDLRGQLDDLANRTSSVSTRVDSYLRVLLRLERKKIDLLLRDVWVLSLDSTDTFDQVSAATTQLSSRLQVAERLDELRRSFEDASATAPPSVTDEIDKNLQLAANHLHSFVLAPEDLNAAKAFLDKAEGALGNLDSLEALAVTVASNFKELQARLRLFPENYYTDLKDALPGVFEILDKPFDDPKNITSHMLFAIDHGIAAIHIALDYAMVRASVPAGPTAHCTNPGQESGARLLVHECELLDLLGKLSWGALREATTLVQEMREDIYESDVLDELAKQGQAEVVFDTQKARRYLPVYFSIGFKDSRFNGAAAIRRLASEWTFPDKLFEDGWKVCHFFQGNEADTDREGQVPVAVTIESQRGTAIAGTGGGKKEVRVLETRIEILPSTSRASSRNFAELLRFLIAFGVALAGLLSGALQQLGKLDFIPATIAIIALGFGADSIKNILSRPVSKSTP